MIRVDVKLVRYLDDSALSSRFICVDEDRWIQKFDWLVMIILIIE